MKLTFSVVVPVYNVASYLPACLDSLIMQNREDWEVICVDDGSTDDCPRILDEYVKRDGRIKVIHQKNAGLSAARNVGMGVASGDWICFVDGDDTVSPSWLSNYARGIGNDVEIVFGGVEQNGKRRVGFDSDKVDFELTGRVIGENNLLQNCFAYSRVWRRDFLTTNGLRFDVGIVFAEDALFNLRALAVAKRISFVSGEDYHYRFVPASLSRKYHSASMYERNAEIFERDLEALSRHHTLASEYVFYVKSTSLLGFRKWALRSAFHFGASKEEKRRLIGALLSDGSLFRATYATAHFPRRAWALLMTLLPRALQFWGIELFAKKI